MAPASAHTATTEPEAAKARPVGFHVYAELKIEFPLPVLPGKQVPVLLLIAVRAACSGRQFLSAVLGSSLSSQPLRGAVLMPNY